MTCRARYEIVENEPGRPLIIRDIGNGGSVPTVTNDVEAVVEELVSAGHLNDGRRLLYYDSEDQLDEILVKDGHFDDFRLLPPEEDVE